MYVESAWLTGKRNSSDYLQKIKITSTAVNDVTRLSGEYLVEALVGCARAKVLRWAFFSYQIADQKNLSIHKTIENKKWAPLSCTSADKASFVAIRRLACTMKHHRTLQAAMKANTKIAPFRASMHRVSITLKFDVDSFVGGQWILCPKRLRKWKQIQYLSQF